MLILFLAKLLILFCNHQATNRTVLHWIKLWDKVVFGRDMKCLKDQKLKNKKGTKEPLRTLSAPISISHYEDMILYIVHGKYNATE